MADGALPTSPTAELGSIWNRHLSAPAAPSAAPSAATPPSGGGLGNIWQKHKVGTSVPAVAPPSDESRGVIATIVDPFGTTGELVKGMARGGRVAVGAVGKLVGADDFATRMMRTPESLEADTEFKDVSGPLTAARWVYSMLGQSLPEMAGVGAAAVGGTAAGGPVGGLAAAYATSTAFNTGRNLQRQFEETGAESVGRAFGAALVQAAPDVLVPGRVGGALTNRLMGIAEDVLTRPGREIATDMAVEASTEVLQQAIEIAQASPENAKIMFNPQTPEDMAKSDGMWAELIEAAVGGGAGGGVISSVGAAARAPRGGGAPATGEGTPSGEGASTAVSEPPVPKGYVRMYHGTPGGEGSEADSGGSRWFSSDRTYARDYRGGGDAGLWYVDVPRDDPMFEAAYENQTVDQGFTVNIDFDPADYGGAKRAMRPRPVVPTQGPPQRGPVGDDYFAILRQRESGGNDAADAATSSALGRYQFIGSTWMGLVNKYRPDLLTGRSEGDVLALRLDEGLQEEMIRHFTRDNGAALSAAGLPVTPASLYMAHHFGPGGAKQLLSASPAARVDAVLPSDVIAANKYLKGKTVGQFVSGLQQQFGGGHVDLTPPMPASATVQTAEDRNGDPLAEAEPLRQKNALTELFAEEFERELEQPLPNISRRLLDARLMPNTSNVPPVQQMLGVAAGRIQVPGLTLSESTAAGRATMSRAGYALEKLKADVDFAVNPPKPNFRNVEVDLDTAPMPQVLRQQFDQQVQDSFARSPFTDEILPQSLNLLASVADRMLGKSDSDVAAKKKGAKKYAHNARERRTGSELRKMNDALKAASEGKMTPQQERDLQKGLMAVQRVDEAAGRALERALRSYRRPSSLDASTRVLTGPTDAGKAVRAFRDRVGVLARTPTLQFDYAKATKGGKATRSRLYTDAISQRLTTSMVLADHRYRRQLNEEFKARRGSKQTREDVLQTEARELTTIETRAMNEAAVNAYVQSLHDATQTLQSQPGGTGLATASMMTTPEVPKTFIRGAPQRMMLRMMTLRQIATSYDRYLPKVRVGRTLRNIADASRIAYVAGDKEGMAIINVGNEIGLRLSNLGPDKLKALGGVMNSVTTYEAHMYPDAKSGIPMTVAQFEDSLLTSQEKGLDANGDPLPAGINAHIPPARREAVRSIYKSFMQLDAEQRRLYLDTRNFYGRTASNVLDIVVRNVAAHKLGPNSNIRSAADARKSLDTMPPDVAEAFKAVLSASRIRGDYFKLDRDSGNWGVHAVQELEFRGSTRAEALAKRRAAMDADPHVQSVGDEFDEQGMEFVLRGRREFYKVYDRESTAKSAAERLRQGDTGSKTFKPTQVSMGLRAEHLWEHNVPPETMQLLKSLVSSVSSPELVDAINSILSNSARAYVRLGRDNVLGASENQAEIIRTSAIRSGLQIRTLHASPEIERIASEAKEQVDEWRRNPQTVEKATHTQEVLNHIGRLNAARRALFDKSIWRDAGRAASSAAVVWYLSSASYYMLNLVQPIVYGVPLMSSVYGARGVRELILHNVRLLKMLPGAVKGTFAEGHDNLQQRTGHYKDVDLRDPKSPLTSLEGRETTTFDPITGEPVYLNNTRSEYDEYERGEINLAHLQFLSETRKQGAFGASFYEAPDEFTVVPDSDAVNITRGEVVGSVAQSAGDLARKGLDWMTARVSAMAEHIEYVNRRAVVDAVYKLETSSKPDAPMTAERIAEIASVADDMTYRVNVDYSAANRTIMHQTLGPIMLFSSFGFHFAYQSWRSFRAMFQPGSTPEFTRTQGAAVFLGMVGVHMFLSGLPAGIPQWMQPLTAVPTALLSMARELFGWGDDDEDEELAKLQSLGFWNYAKAWTRENLGDSAADVLFNGVPSATFGLDLSGRINLNQLYTFVDIETLTQGEDQFKDAMFGLMGPVPGIGASVLRNIEKLEASGFSGPALLEAFSPVKAGRDIGRAWHYGENGMTDRSGKVLLNPEQIGAMDMMVQAIGFTPGDVAGVYRKRGIDYDMKTRIGGERDRIFQRYRQAETPEERRAANAMRREFNAKYPDFRITNEGLVSSRRSTKETEKEFERTGGVDREKRAVYETIRDVEGTPDGN